MIVDKSSDEARSKRRNIYVAKIRRTKKNYFRNQAEIQKRKGGVWKVIKQKPKNVEWSIEINGGITSDKSIIAEHFKNSFCTKVSKLRKQPQLDRIFNKLSSAIPSPPKWDIPTITKPDLLKAIDKLKVSNSSGPDIISNKFIYLKIRNSRPPTNHHQWERLTWHLPRYMEVELCNSDLQMRFKNVI